MSAGSSQIRILTVDDHPVVRQGIAGLLAIQPDITLVGEASNGREAIQQFRAHRPDVTLMEFAVRGGLKTDIADQATEIPFAICRVAGDDVQIPFQPLPRG